MVISQGVFDSLIPPLQYLPHSNRQILQGSGQFFLQDI